MPQRVQIHGLDGGWRAGQHIYVRLMHGTLAFESHPISIANAPYSVMPGRGMDLHIKTTGDWSNRIRDIAQRTPAELQADQNDGDPARICKVVVQGPYGGLTYTDPAKSEACMLVAGGSGITFSLALLEDLIGSALAGGRRRRTRTRILALVWVVRDPDLVKTFANQLQALIDLARGALFFSVRIHITSPPTGDPEKLRMAIPGATLFADRPDLSVLLDSLIGAVIGPSPELYRGTPCKGGMHLLACGPTPLIQSVRTAARKVERGKQVQLGGLRVHCEVFGW